MERSSQEEGETNRVTEGPAQSLGKEYMLDVCPHPGRLSCLHDAHMEWSIEKTF